MQPFPNPNTRAIWAQNNHQNETHFHQFCGPLVDIHDMHNTPKKPTNLHDVNLGFGNQTISNQNDTKSSQKNHQKNEYGHMLQNQIVEGTGSRYVFAENYRNCENYIWCTR